MKLYDNTNTALFFRPSNLNIEEAVNSSTLFRLLPRRDYEWLMEKKKIGKRSRNQQYGLPNIGYLYLFITKLIQCEMCRNGSTPGDWVNISGSSTFPVECYRD
jgi:hypothetical protein